MEATERRRRQRYNIALNLQYSILPRRALPVRGEGVTENVSSSGLLFRRSNADEVPVGASVIMDLMWPARSPGETATRLWVTGFVVRVARQDIAVSISTHDFKRGEAERQAGPVAIPKDPSLQALIVVVDTEEIYRLVLAALAPHRHRVTRVDAAVAKYLLRAEQSNIGLLVTNQLEGFEECIGRLPVIYTGEEKPSPSMGNVIALSKPFRRRLLRSALLGALDKMDPAAKVD